MKTLILTLALSLVFSLIGCTGTDPTSDARPAEAERTAASPTDVKPADDSSTRAVTGVAACDEYLEKLEEFIENPKVPQASKDAFKGSLEQNRTAWKQAASTPQGKAGLESSCKMALDSIKPTLEQWK